VNATSSQYYRELRRREGRVDEWMGEVGGVGEVGEVGGVGEVGEVGGVGEVGEGH